MDNCLKQHVLFLIDTSGSIRRSRFCRVNCAIANLVTWFCKPVSFAVMTFSDSFHKEFCFDAYSNECSGRLSAKTAIKNIGYRDGLTFTGRAIKCAFREMIDGDCGFSGSYDCLTIVIVTDGNSNGPSDTCAVARRYRDMHPGVKMYSIGIGNVDRQELECLASEPSSQHLFQHPDFDSFLMELDDLYDFLLIAPIGSSCANAIYQNVPIGSGRSCQDIQKDQC